MYKISLNNREQIHQNKLEDYSAVLPCGHKFNLELFSNTTVKQIIINKKSYCIECGEDYNIEHVEIIKKLYKNIQIEKQELKKNLRNQSLSKEEKDNIISLRKQFYLNQLNQLNISYTHLVITMFEILFDTVYFI